MNMSPQSHHDFENAFPYNGVSTKSIPLSKLVFDKAFSAIALVLTSPIIFLISVAVFLEGRGPVFFTHTRIGRGGEPFSCLKFRTMNQNSDERLAQVLAIDPIAKEEWDKSRKVFRDPRVSSLGAFLRKSSMEELPQFWNILVGDMSVVGPRPITREEVHYYGDDFSVYSSVRPGLTGLWQIGGRSETEFKERVDLDVSYVRDWCLSNDLRIVWKTIDVVVLGKGAY
jgi:exopolysaccharide production protein ExoY